MKWAIKIYRPMRLKDKEYIRIYYSLAQASESRNSSSGKNSTELAISKVKLNKGNRLNKAVPLPPPTPLSRATGRLAHLGGTHRLGIFGAAEQLTKILSLGWRGIK